MNNLKNKIRIIKRTLIEDQRGWFLKAITGTEEGIPSCTGEVYLTMATPGQSKGGHYHPEASEWFTLVAGEAILKLEDIFTNEKYTLSLKFSEPTTVFVPNNVAHIFVNENDKDFILLAYTDKLYNPKDTIAYEII